MRSYMAVWSCLARTDLASRAAASRRPWHRHRADATPAGPAPVSQDGECCGTEPAITASPALDPIVFQTDAHELRPRRYQAFIASAIAGRYSWAGSRAHSRLQAPAASERLRCPSHRRPGPGHFEHLDIGARFRGCRLARLKAEPAQAPVCQATRSGTGGLRSTWTSSQPLHHHHGRLGVQQRFCRLSKHRRVA